MRTFVISDLHGNNELFRKALKQVGLKKNDRLILLGDMIDRGDDSKGVLDTIFLLKEHGFYIDLLFGNHEVMFLEALTDTNVLSQWLRNGGDKTLSSFLTSSIEKIPVKYIDLLRASKYYLEVEGFILVHAALNMILDNPFEDIHTILWERDPQKYLVPSFLGDRRLIHGHSPTIQEDIVRMIKYEPIICIDNGSFLKRESYGSVCILELETMKVDFIQ